MKRLTAVVYGIVQGVSFRYYTQMTGHKLGISGYVRNQRDGTVLVIAEGGEEALRRLLEWLHHGSPAARVSRVEAEWTDATGEFSKFGVRL